MPTCVFCNRAFDKWISLRRHQSSGCIGKVAAREAERRGVQRQKRRLDGEGEADEGASLLCFTAVDRSALNVCIESNIVILKWMIAHSCTTQNTMNMG